MICLIFISWILSIVAIDQPSVSQHQVNVLSSKLTIHGKTNVNTFECELNQAFNHEILKVTSENSDFVIDFDGLVLKYGVSRFDCGHEIMNKDFREILNSSEHPFFFLKINEIYIREETSLMDKLDVKSFVTISLAGVERTKIIQDGVVINHDDQTLTFMGSRTLQMTEFNIKPPTKFLGLVSVEDELKVSFEIRMKTTPIK